MFNLIKFFHPANIVRPFIFRFCDAPDPPKTDPRMYQIMEGQVALSAEAMDFMKKSSAEQSVRQQALDQMNLKLGDSMLQDSALNRQRSQDAYDFYKEKGQPLQEKLIDEATNYDSEGNISAFRGRAAADVNAAYGNIEQQQSRTLSRYGVMPNANRLATINSQLLASKAASQAGAMTNAEQGVRDRAVSMRGNAANVAAGLPAQALQFGQAGQQQQQQAFQNSMSANNANLQNTQMMQSGYGQAGNLMGQAANTGNAINGQQMQAWQGATQAQANESAGWGSALGAAAAMFMMADGGTVGGDDNADGSGGAIQGPGNGVSDSIPAVNATNGRPVRISNGEFVVPADVVRAKGEEFFNKLIEKHHTPAALQRKQRRIQ
jgi:hypothetical protein